MDGPSSGRRPSRAGSTGRPFRPDAGRTRRAPTGTAQRRSLVTVLARHAARVRSRRALWSGVLRALGTTLVAALLAAPFAALWGIGHAEVEDYVGPHRVTFATSFSGEIAVDLGPIGRAFLPSPVAPVGVTATVGSVGTAASTLNSLFSSKTLAAYTSLYEEPEVVIGAIVDELQVAALLQGAGAEAVLLLAFAVWRLRSQLLSPWVARTVTRRRTGVAYVVVLVLVLGSILAPSSPAGTRIPITIAAGSRFASVTVDSRVLADLLDRGVRGVTLLSGRQQAAVRTYVDTAVDDLSSQLDRLPRPRPGETMLLGFSDLHCNQAMTELITRLTLATRPRVVLSSGDDTVNGTAVEKTCIRREAGIAAGAGVPLVVSSGNHDSDVTEAQQRAEEMVVLDGGVVEVAGLRTLGDDDPEHNVPFSQDRTLDRPESEEQLGARMLQAAAARPVDVLLVHQPAASVVLMTAADPGARLVLWGHFHSEAGPTVVEHADGSWTVGMQEGTAGGVRQPTITSFSTPFSPPLKSADVYFYFRDDATGLITGVQPVHFTPDAEVVIDDRVVTGDVDDLPAETRARLSGSTPSPTATPTG
ncbi:Calcineurin-like phosphoesterase [Friedmanniella luteola]|uniref:Calcineurin-like phosphoesterase n=1 Tax=Friedmanniella luteola TaxID=546871 RepID=A0A1H1N1P1_9ACTN|nr:Calcineurin-like phosphoesterase [Friedmanniella luteola]